MSKKILLLNFHFENQDISEAQAGFSEVLN